MNNAKHTPGPWVVDRMMGSDSYVRAENGDLIASAYWMNDQKAIPARSNARLIAAAPDMLEALLAIRSLREVPIPEAGKPSTRLGGIFADDFAKVEEAIAKAVGADERAVA